MLYVNKNITMVIKSGSSQKQRTPTSPMEWRKERETRWKLDADGTVRERLLSSRGQYKLMMMNASVWL